MAESVPTSVPNRPRTSLFEQRTHVRRQAHAGRCYSPAGAIARCALRRKVVRR